MDTMGNEEIAEEQFKEIRAKIKALVEEAQKIADELGVEFEYVPQNIGTYYPAGFEERTEGEWYPSSWSSSSLYC